MKNEEWLNQWMVYKDWNVIGEKVIKVSKCYKVIK